MALTREHVIDTAFGILRDYGIADLSMRRLARDLNVQPGALYWHVKNKQDLLGVLAVMILAPVTQPQAAGAQTAGAQIDSLRLHARSIRQALLAVRDGAEVVALTHTLAPHSLPALQGLTRTFAAAGLPPGTATWAGRALTHYILGTVTHEQTRSAMAQAGLVAAAAEPVDDTDSFNFGLELLLAGATRATATASGGHSQGKV